MKRSLLTIPLILLLASCGVHERYAYLGDAPRNESIAVNSTYTSTIYPDDRLYIYVYSQTPESAMPFNEETNRSDYSASRSYINSSKQQFSPKGYLVGSDGTIIYPLLGTLSTKGMTTDSLAHELERRLKESHYVSDAIVTVSLMNFRVTVIGEVKVPQQLHADGSRMTIFEAIAQCGDITMDGVRSNVMVIRTDSAGQRAFAMDLTSRTVFDSPCYYLQQNDIVYVTPTEKKKRRAYRNEDWPGYISLGASAVNAAYNVVYRWLFDSRTKEMLRNQ